MKTFKVEYDSFKDLRLAMLPLSICQIGPFWWVRWKRNRDDFGCSSRFNL